MHFILDFPEATVFAMSRVDNLPHCKVNITKMRLKWLKDEHYNITIALYGEKVKINYYDIDEDTNSLFEKTLLGENINEI
jgi:hypothetical protein